MPQIRSWIHLICRIRIHESESATLIKSPFNFSLCRECCPCWCPTSATWSAWSSPTRTHPWSRTTATATPGSHPEYFLTRSSLGVFFNGVFWPGFLTSGSESRSRFFLTEIWFTSPRRPHGGSLQPSKENIQLFRTIPDLDLDPLTHCYSDQNRTFPPRCFSKLLWYTEHLFFCFLLLHWTVFLLLLNQCLQYPIIFIFT